MHLHLSNNCHATKFLQTAHRVSENRWGCSLLHDCTHCCSIVFLIVYCTDTKILKPEIKFPHIFAANVYNGRVGSLLILKPPQLMIFKQSLFPQNAMSDVWTRLLHKCVGW